MIQNQKYNVGDEPIGILIFDYKADYIKDDFVEAQIKNSGFGDKIKERIQYVDAFTPMTVKKFTSHFNGAIYGAPNKVKDGTTSLENVFICGTDQGFLGIIGALLSGISMANLHLLR